MALSAKNKVGFIDGSIPKPTRSSEPDLQQWIRCNNMVTSWLYNSLSKDLVASVIYSESAHEMWKDLKERFSQTNAPHLFQIEREIHDLTQDTMSIAAYFTRLKGLWDELNALSPTPSCSCGAMKEVLEYQRRQRTIPFLMGLHESYSTVRGQILLIMIYEQPSVNKVFSLVLQEERQRDITSVVSIPEAAALVSKSNA